MLVVRGVDVRYGRVTAVRAAALTVARGELVTIVGPNGAGKTSLLRAITGLVPAAAGTVQLDGVPLERRAPEDIVRLGIVMVAEGRELFGTLSVRDNLRLGAYSAPRAGRARRMAGDLERVLALFPRCGRAWRRRRPRSREASSRWSPSGARSWRVRGCSSWTSRRWGWRRSWCATSSRSSRA